MENFSKLTTVGGGSAILTIYFSLYILVGAAVLGTDNFIDLLQAVNPFGTEQMTQ